MALTAAEEELVRDLISQQAELMSLAANEPTITSKLSATKATLDMLPAATGMADDDLFLVRQAGAYDRKITGEMIGSYVSMSSPQQQCGTYDAILHEIGSVSAIGAAKGYVLGPLPPAAVENNSDYFICQNNGTDLGGLVPFPPETVAPTLGDYVTSDGVNWNLMDIAGGTGQMYGTASTKAIFYNSRDIAENITILAGTNGLSAGPVTVADGFSVTVEDGANWVVIE
jgi:hypothetical protein